MESISGSARSADRALDILELLSGRGDGLSLSEIAAELGIPPSSLHGILNVLRNRGYLVRVDAKRRYRLGAKVLDLGAGYLSGTGLYAEARQLMRELAELTPETVHVAILEEARIIYVDTIESSHSMRMISPLGERLPAHATAAGKALLSALSDRQIELLYAEVPLDRYTWRTVTSLPDLLREVQQIRLLGVARDSEEYAEGLCCIAGVLTGRAGRAAAVSVSMPAARMTAERSIELTRTVQTTVARASQAVQTFASSGPRRAVRVAWSMGSMGVQAYEEMYRAARTAAEHAGIELLWTNARDDLSRQAADLDRLLALQPDVILIHAPDAARAEGLFSQASAAGIPVLCFQRPSRTAALDAFIGADTFSVGRMQIDFVAAQLGGRGNVVVIEGDPYNDNARNIARGVLDTAASHPNLRILLDQPAPHWSPEAARTIADHALARHGKEIHAFVTANDAMAGGVLEALETYGLAGRILLVGADGDQAALQRIRAGTQHGTAFQSPRDLAEAALSFAVDAARGIVQFGTLPLRSIFHNPPGPEVRVREVPYLFVSRDTLTILERYWSSVYQVNAGGVAS